MRAQLVWTITLLACFLPSVMGQGSCVPFNSTLCESVGIPAGTMAFLPASGIPNTLAPFNPTQAVTNILSIFNVIVESKECYSLIINALCLSTVRPCLQIGNVTYPVPVPPCRPLCDALAAKCTPIWKPVNLPFGVGIYNPRNRTFPLQCNVTDGEAQMVSMWPEYNVTYTLDSNATVDVPCVAYDANTIVKRKCQEPLENPDGGQCGYGCPLPALTDDQYSNAKIMQGIVGWISWCTSWVLIISYLVNPALRKFPKTLVLMVAIASNIAAGGIILPTMVGYHNIWCGGEEQVIVPQVTVVVVPKVRTTVVIEDDDLLFGSSPCAFQGAILLFAFLAAVFWWAIIAFNMCFELYFRKFNEFLERRWVKWMRIVIYQLIGWGLPALATIITASADRIKFASGATYCFVSHEDNNAYQLTFWFIPVGLALLMGFVLFILAMGRLLVAAFRVAKWRQFLLMYYRLLLFIFFYLFLFTFIFSYNLQIEANRDDIISGFEEYYTCLIAPSLRVGQTSCNLSDLVSNYDLVMLKGFAISALGFFVFITFLSWDIIFFWYTLTARLTMMIIKRDPRYGSGVLKMLRSETGLTLTSSQSLTVTLSTMPSTADELEEEEEEEEKGDEKDEDEDSSSSSS